MRQLIWRIANLHFKYIARTQNVAGSIRFAVRIRRFSPISPRAVAFIDVASRGHGVVERAKFSRNALHGASADSALSGNFQNTLAGP